ncbi:hypothetical protein EVAR_37765_1 [Eumeta japonica]|uniref:Uncharacterized protein n=1 Tax=Eumeta variegata TaxID=151549 RepID=A0A4C1WQK1_EUMVA|nr:hypothetical protein EVAR_37765_1 [Eumeta japonica]
MRANQSHQRLVKVTIRFALLKKPPDPEKVSRVHYVQGAPAGGGRGGGAAGIGGPGRRRAGGGTGRGARAA